MSAAATLAEARAAGFVLTVEGGGLRCRPTPPPDLLDRLRTHKAELIANLLRPVEREPQIDLGWLLLGELGRLERRHPAGVEPGLLMSHFISALAAERERVGLPKLRPAKNVELFEGALHEVSSRVVSDDGLLRRRFR